MDYPVKPGNDEKEVCHPGDTAMVRDGACAPPHHEGGGGAGLLMAAWPQIVITRLDRVIQ